MRGRATGLAASGLIAAQGLAILVCGLIAEASAATTAVALCGAGGLVLATGLLVTRGARSALSSVPVPAKS
jgi:hypothetical protein